MDRKGRLLSIWWFIILAIIAAGVMVGVSLYYSAEINVKDVEAGVLSEKIANCLIVNGRANIILENNFSIYGRCGLSEETFGKGSNFFFRVELLDKSGNLIKEIRGGQQSFEEDCKISDKLDAKAYAKCRLDEEQVIYWDGTDKLGILRINAGSNQNGRVIPVVNGK